MTFCSILLASALALLSAPDAASDSNQTASTAPIVEEGEKTAENASSEGVPEVSEAKMGAYKSLSLVILGEEQGELASVDCRDGSGGGNTYDFASQVTFLKSLTEKNGAKSADDPIVLSMGDTIFPGAFAKYLSDQGDQGLKSLAELIHTMPFDLLSVGNHDLSQASEKTQSYFTSARALKMPYLVANVTCEDATHPLCLSWDGKSDTKPYRIVSRNGLQIGLTSLIDPTIMDQVAKDRLNGVKIAEPKDALKALAAQMRLDGADVVIALFHQGKGRTSSEMLQLVEGVDVLDVLITDKLFPGEDKAAQDGKSGYAKMGQIIGQGGKVRVMASTSGKNMASVIQLTLVEMPAGQDGKSNKPTYQVFLANPQAIETNAFEPDAQVKALLTTHGDQMCASWGKPLSQSAKLSESFGLEEMSQFVLNTMRFTTQSEVAFMNTGAFREVDETPLKDTLSELDVHATLPFDSQIVTARMLGSELEKVCSALGKGLSAAGVEKTKKGELIINGRPLNKKRKYSVVMNEFVAEGSGGFLKPKQLLEVKRWQNPEANEDASKSSEGNEATSEQLQPAMLSQVIQDAVADNRFAQKNEDGTFTLSPTKGFPNLYHSMLWHLGGYLNASYGHMVIKNPNQAVGYDGDYDKSRLTATATDHLDIDFKLLANGSTRNHGWDNDFVIQYATTREKGPEEDNIFEEDKDVVRLRSAYKYLGQRANMGDVWYAPVPFVEAQVETELTKPSDSNHPLDLTGILGLLLKFHDKLEYKIGVNVKGDALEPHGQITVGLFTGYRLLKADLLEIHNRTLLQFESEAEYFYNVQYKNHIHELRWENRLFLKITDHFSLTGSFNMYLYKTSEVGELGRAIEGKIGLSMELEQMFQKF